MRNQVAFIVTFLFALTACSGQGEKHTNSKKNYSEIDLSSNIDDRRIFYRFPAPNDIINYIKTEKFVYQKEILNPLTNANKYIDTRLQHFNLGVYSTDFAYITVFKTLSDASDYFKSMETLAYQTGLSSVFDDKLRKRVQSNEANIDSLSNIARESFNSMVINLTAIGNEKQLAIIFAGGYVEILYIALSQIDDFSKDNVLLRKVYDQRYGLENLTQFISNFKDDPWIYSLNKKLYTILDAFNLVEEKILNESIPVKQQAGEFKLSGGRVEVLITNSNFQLLKDRVFDIRKNYTNPLGATEATWK